MELGRIGTRGAVGRGGDGRRGAGAPFFTERERAALAWTETVTEVAHSRVPDDVDHLARQHFNEKELVDLTLAVVTINGWNRLAISFREVPGIYRPRAAEHQPVAEAGAGATRT